MENMDNLKIRSDQIAGEEFCVQRLWARCPGLVGTILANAAAVVNSLHRVVDIDDFGLWDDPHRLVYVNPIRRELVDHTLEQ